MKAFLLAPLLLLGAVPPQEEPSLDWLLGNWQVSYRDAALGEVTGHVIVERDAAGTKQTDLFMRYVAEHPLTLERYELTGIGVRQKRGVLEAAFFGPVPTAKVEVAAGAPTLTAVPGQAVRASLEGSEATAVAGPAGPVHTRIILRFEFDPAKPPAGRMEGTWRQKPSPLSGPGAVRGGVLKDGMAVGAEVWSRAAISIDSVSIAEMNNFGYFRNQGGKHPPERPLQEFWLRISGDGLPVEPGQKVAVTFQDPRLRFVDAHRVDPEKDAKGRPQLQIRVEIQTGIQPGPKALTVNGAAGSWEFDFPGLQPWDIRCVRRIRDDQTEAVAQLHTGEIFTIEVEYPHEPFYSERRFSTFGGKAELSFTVVKDLRRPAVFQAGPFLLVEPGAAGPLLRESLLPSGVKGVIVARPQDMMMTVGVDVHPLGVEKPFGLCEVADDPEDLWETALVMAQENRRRHPERYDVTNIIGTGLKKLRTNLTAEDHAALLLVHGEICALLAKIVEEATAVVGLKDLQAFARVMVREFRAKRAVEHPLIGYPVPEPAGPGNTALSELLGAGYEAKHFKDKPDAYLEFVIRSIAYAQGKMAGEAAEGLRYYSAVNRWNPQDLLKAVGRGYGRVSALLMPRLLRLHHDNEPLYPRWIPDRTARESVATLESLAEAVMAQEAYSGIDTALVVLAATAGSAMLSVPLAALGRLCFVALDLLIVHDFQHDMSRWAAASRRARAARGTASFAGEAPEQIAANEAADALFSAVVGAVTQIGGSLFLHVVAADAAPCARSIEMTLEHASRIGASNLKRFEREVFEYLLSRARQRLGNGGLDALDAIDRRVFDLAFPGGGRPAPPALPAGKMVEEAGPPSRFESSSPETVADPFAGLHGKVARDAESGSVGALDRLERLARIERSVDAMAPAQKGRVHEALEILRRLGELQPAVKQLDPVEALRMMAFHSGDSALSSAELVARVTAWNKISVDPEALARAANASLFEGEITAARAGQWANRFNGRPGPPRPVRTDTPSKMFVKRHKEIAELLDRIGGWDSPKLSATVAADRGLDPLTAAVGLALTRKPPVPPARLRQVLGLTEDQLRTHLDDFLRLGDQIEDEAARATRVRQAFEDQTAAAPPPPPPVPKPDAPTSPTLGGERAPRSQVESQVRGHLREIGLSPDQIEKLDIARALDQEGLGAAEIVVATAYAYEIPASRLTGLLGIDRVEMAAILDRVMAKRFPGAGAYVRAEKAAEYMGRGSIGAVIEARTREFLRKIRGVAGASEAQVPLGAAWDVDSAVVGMCFDQGIAPDLVRRAMKLDDAGLRAHLDRFLNDHFHIRSPAERTTLIDDYLAGRKPPMPATAVPAPVSVRRPVPQLESGELAAELRRMGVEGPEAARAAKDLAPLAERDARLAIAAGAWDAGVPPARLQEALGLSRPQVVGVMDRMLAERFPGLGMKERAQTIADFVNKADGSKLGRNDILDLLNQPAARPPSTPHRAPAVDPPGPPPVDPHARTAIEPVDATTKIEAQPLDALYGSSQRPRGERVKPWERGTGEGGVLRNPERAELVRGAAPKLDRAKKYLWLVDRDGKLVIGVEAPIASDPRLQYGHPSLNGGGEARIAGELAWDAPSGRWVVNNKSGRYSLHADRGPDQLRNAAARFAEAGVGPLGMDYFRPPESALPR